MKFLRSGGEWTKDQPRSFLSLGDDLIQDLDDLGLLNPDPRIDVAKM